MRGAGTTAYCHSDRNTYRLKRHTAFWITEHYQMQLLPKQRLQHQNRRFEYEDVKATGNWWGGEDPSTTIFDAEGEPGIGRVLFKPFSNERILWQ
jgi:hypothetical protein